MLSLREKTLHRALFVLVALAVGALLGDAFIHLIPEAFERLGQGPRVPALILAGIAGFFVLEKFLHWRHEHDLEASGHIHPVGPMNLVANGIHNFVDGVLIGASFQAGPAVGLATTLAVVMHEIPQEIGNFAVLVHAGYARGQALRLNFFAGCAALLGAVAVLCIGSYATPFVNDILPFAAGGFIYIAGCDLVPQLHREKRPLHSLAQLLAASAGVALMFSLLALER